ncbi:NAD(P)/FAD-dependent oxidoreductase [Pseudonocardia xishanensis]|uniref:FAD-dependent oxidoreductase n=1 Tax=Pseudonocardia xishanensis TaxID=630995 RepID=A0ABP8RPA2_9PSEU
MTEKSKVVVLGGGYAGTLAASHLRTDADTDVTLVNPRPEFVQRIRLHQLVAGTGEAALGYDGLLAEGVRLVVDEAARIDVPGRRVELASGAVLDYDYLVYAVGSRGAVPPAHAYPIAEVEHARLLRAALVDLPADAPVTVVGGGLTGIETAAELAEQGRSVALVTGGTLAPSLSEKGRRSIAATLAGLGVTVLDDVVTEVREGAVVLGAGERPSAVTVWTAGFAVPDLAARSGLRTDEVGRLVTDDTLTSIDDDRIVAAGDAAAPSGRALRMSCQAAQPMGLQAARTVLSRIAGTEPRALDPRFVGSCVSVGRHAGTVQVARKDDTPLDVVVGGRLGARIKELVCRSTMMSIRGEARRPGSVARLLGSGRPAREEVS